MCEFPKPEAFSLSFGGENCFTVTFETSLALVEFAAVGVTGVEELRKEFDFSVNDPEDVLGTSGVADRVEKVVVVGLVLVGGVTGFFLFITWGGDRLGFAPVCSGLKPDGSSDDP